MKFYPAKKLQKDGEDLNIVVLESGETIYKYKDGDSYAIKAEKETRILLVAGLKKDTKTGTVICTQVYQNLAYGEYVQDAVVVVDDAVSDTSSYNVPVVIDNNPMAPEEERVYLSPWIIPLLPPGSRCFNIHGKWYAASNA